MRIGSLNIPFLIQSVRVVADGEGGSIAQMSTFATAWGSLEDVREKGAIEDFNKPTHIVRMRKRTDIEITTEHRLKFVSRIFQIRAIHDHDSADRFLKIYVSEMTQLN